jgi:Zn-dependent protease with chaperone function
MRDWADRQGGLESGSLQQRAERSAAAIAAECSGHCITLHVLATDSVSAFSWPSGDVFVTRGLVHLLDDAELSAAIAHELGHLLSDGHLKSIVSLKGYPAHQDREERADAFGAALLRAQHIRPTAMATMLKKVRDRGTISPACREALDHRIQILAE